MNYQQLLVELYNVLSNQNHYQLTKFLVDHKDNLLEIMPADSDVISNFLNLSLYNNFISQGTWQNIIREAIHQSQLHQMLDQPINNPSPRIIDALIDTFKLCFGISMPYYTKRIITLLSDQQILISIANWIMHTDTSTHIHYLKKKGYLLTDDIKQIKNLLETNQNQEICIQFSKGSLDGWCFNMPTVHSNKKMVDLMWCYQGMGWTANLSECLEIDNSRSLLVRMDGGSDGCSRMTNIDFFTNAEPITFNLINWSEFLTIAPEIIRNQPAFNHPNVISAP
jgi:hypothetical protein